MSTPDLFPAPDSVRLPLSALPQEPAVDAKSWFPMRGKTLEQSRSIFEAWKATGRKGANPTLPSSNGLVWCGICGCWNPKHCTVNCDKAL